MMNFFNKKERKHCYLTESKVVDKETLEKEDLSTYDEFLANPNIDPYYEKVISQFLKPYRISFLKYTFNDEYFSQPFPVDLKHNHQHISPTLRTIKKDSTKRAMGYPSWFYAAFPDVIDWAAQGEGNNQLKDIFSNYSEDDLFEDGKIRFDALEIIINTYLSTTGKYLECEKIY